jgi:hypothetical protein
MQRAVSIHALYQQISLTINERILAESDGFILGTPTDKLTEYYFNNFTYPPIEIDPERTHTVNVKKNIKIIPARQREWAFQNEGDLKAEFEYLVIHIPILPHAQLDIVKTFEPSRYDTGFFGEDLKWTNGAITFDIPIKGYNIRKEEDGIKREVEQSIQWVFNKLHYISSDLEMSNRDLKERIAQAVNVRKSKIEEDQARHSSLLKKINIPLRQKENEAIKHIRLDPKPLINRVRPAPQQPEEYILDEEKVLDIISVLDNQGSQFEKTSTTYQKLGEEDLRNILLGNLNSVFEGKATGETFCMNGKTDIYLRLDKGNILSFECKFWHGQKGYQETIDQLLKYLTWRMNYGVIVLFSKQKNFTNILEEGGAAIQAHPSYRGNFQIIKKTHFRSYHAIPTDENKHVQLHHLFYTLTTE